MSDDEEEEFLEEIVDGVVDQFLQEFKLLLAEVFLEPDSDSLSLPQPTEVEGSPPSKPPETEEEYRTYVWNFIEKNLSAFYEPGDPFVEDIVQKAALRAQELTTTYHLAPETTPKLVKLALYDFVVLCDDSGSMKKGDRIEALKDTLQRVADIATFLQPSGISLRFLNYSKDQGFDNLDDEEHISEIIGGISFNGPTRLGKVLNSKIVEPLIIQKVRTISFKRPAIVVIITDGRPNKENPEELQDTILRCKRSRELEPFGPASVVFLISRVGEDKEAEIFLNDLHNNKELYETLYCCMDKLDDEREVFKKVNDDLGYSSFLIKLFAAAFDRQTK